jgi:hypothetical protein
VALHASQAGFTGADLPGNPEQFAHNDLFNQLAPFL